MEKIAVIFDLLGVITEESMFATDVVYPIIKDKISYDLFKKKYLLYAIGIIKRDEFWDFICSNDEIKFFEEKIIKKTKITTGVKDTIKKLLRMDCKLYLATEIPREWGQMLLKKANINNTFKKEFYSSDLMTTKPFMEFYKIVFKNIGNQRIYYVDDTLINLIAAKRYKEHKTIFYNLKNKIDRKKITDYAINNLKELIDICKTKKS